jgi:hypothetical protein
MDCFFNEGIKVLYRAAMAILLLFYKHSVRQNSEWMNEILTNGIDSALTKFCKQIPVKYKSTIMTDSHVEKPMEECSMFIIN